MLLIIQNAWRYVCCSPSASVTIHTFVLRVLVSPPNIKHGFSPQHLAVSSGSGVADLEKLCAILEAVPILKYICLDVANGYSEYFVEFVKTVREKFPKHTIMVRGTLSPCSGDAP